MGEGRAVGGVLERKGIARGIVNLARVSRMDHNCDTLVTINPGVSGFSSPLPGATHRRCIIKNNQNGVVFGLVFNGRSLSVCW